MNKYLKGCLLILGILLSVILIISGYIYYHMSTSRERNAADDIECSNQKYIFDRPLIALSDSIATKNIKNVKLFVITDSKFVDSIEIENNFDDRIEFNFPLKKIPLSSKLIIKTKSHEFLIENMNYFNDARWGMFGYLGKNCQFTYDSKRLK